MGDVAVVEDSVAVVEEREVGGDVVDVVVTVLDVVLSATMVDESDVAGGSDAALEGPVSLDGRLETVVVGNGTVLSVLEDTDDEAVAESVGSIVALTGGVSSSGTSNGAPVPSQYRLSALGPPHTCDASPLHAMSQWSSEIRAARLFSRLPQKHSPAYSVPARL